MSVRKHSTIRLVWCIGGVAAAGAFSATGCGGHGWAGSQSAHIGPVGAPSGVYTQSTAESSGGAPVYTSASSTPASVSVPAPPPAPASDSVHDGEHYEAAPVSGVFQAARDSLATFSLDVDTASYTLMRRDVTAGRRPQRDGVRAEEYLNFFRYDGLPYRPLAEAPFGVHLESAPSYFGDTGARLLRVGVRTQDIATAQRPEANLVFLVDVSGSMQSANKLPLVQLALETLVQSLRPDDTIGLVVYAGADAIVLEPTAVRERARILEAIRQLSAGGGTNGAAGIRTAYDLAAQHFRRGGINRVVLCTDGDFNVGVVGDALISLIEQERERGVTLTALGFGDGNYNDHDMERLADHGNGNYAYIDSPNEAKRFLQRDLGATLQVLAKDVKVQVRFDPALVADYRLIGYDNRVLADEDFRNDAVDAGEVGAGQSVTAYLEYHVRPGLDLARDQRPVAVVAIRYKRPSENQSREVSASITARDLGTSFDAATPQFRFGAAALELAEILRESPFSTGRRFGDVERILRASTWNQDPDARELAELTHRVAEL